MITEDIAFGLYMEFEYRYRHENKLKTCIKYCNKWTKVEGRKCERVWGDESWQEKRRGFMQRSRSCRSLLA